MSFYKRKFHWSLISDYWKHFLDASSEDTSTEDVNAQYTVVNISDVSAFQNAHTVIEEPKPSSKTRILSTTVNEDGTTTLMVATEPDDNAGTANVQINEQIIDDETVVFLRIPDENEDQK